MSVPLLCFVAFLTPRRSQGGFSECTCTPQKASCQQPKSLMELFTLKQNLFHKDLRIKRVCYKMYPPVPSNKKHELKMILSSSLVSWTPVWSMKMLFVSLIVLISLNQPTLDWLLWYFCNHILTWRPLWGYFKLLCNWSSASKNEHKAVIVVVVVPNYWHYNDCNT